MKNLFKTTLLFATIACGFYACTEDYFEFEKIKVDDLNYTPESLGDKFAVRLAEFEV